MPIANYDLFYAHFGPFVASYVGRRADSGAVGDLVAEVFAVAWKRRVDVPEDALPWLYAVGRNVLGNHYRADERRAALQAKMRAVPVEVSDDPADIVSDRDGLAAAIETLADDDRELLLLVAWEGLTPAEVGVVMGIASGAASVRLHRARKRLERAMAASTGGHRVTKTEPHETAAFDRTIPRADTKGER